jgi:Arc/MetJ-type ribon-helix-helix transcriptional regulator
MKQINMKIPDAVISDLDRYVERSRFNNRASLIRSILFDWIEQRKGLSADRLNSVDIHRQNTADN